MSRKKKTIIISMFLCGFFCNDNPLFAWDNTWTHPVITENVLKKKDGLIKDYFQATLGLENGLEERFDGKKLIDIIKKGSDTEDDGLRAMNHFYNPLDGSGLHDWGKTGVKNPEWAKDYSSNEYSWKNARQYYYEALTETDNKARSKKFALAFRSLGQVMHLIQDMGVPAHTRNDLKGHVEFQEVNLGNPLNWWANNFEYYVKWQQKHNNQTILSYCYPNAAPNFNELSLFWHTDSGEGLADYSNANFLSKYRMLDAPGFPHPSKTDTNWNSIDWLHPEQVDAEDGKIDGVIYIKQKAGEGVKHLAGVGYLTKDYDAKRPIAMLNDECHKDYAEKLLPKAGAYAEGILSYFFRGKLSVTDIAIVEGSSDGITKITAKVANATPNDAATSGTLIAFARFKTDPAAKDFSYAVSRGSADRVSLSSDNPSKCTFNFPENSIPADVKELYLHVVYHGNLGTEENIGIAVGMSTKVKKEYALVQITGQGVTKAFVWDPLKDDYADIKKPDGTPITECDLPELDAWMSNVTDARAEELYDIIPVTSDREIGCHPDSTLENYNCQDAVDKLFYNYAGQDKISYITSPGNYSIEETSDYGDNCICKNNTSAKTSLRYKHHQLESSSSQGTNVSSCLTTQEIRGNQAEAFEQYTPFGQLFSYNFTGYGAFDSVADDDGCNYWTEGPTFRGQFRTYAFPIEEMHIFTKGTMAQLYSYQYIQYIYQSPKQSYFTDDPVYTKSFLKSEFYIHAQIAVVDGENQNPITLGRNSKFEEAIKSLNDTWEKAIGIDWDEAVGIEPNSTLYWFTVYHLTASLLKDR